MKPDVERIFTKLASQKVELAKKPEAVLKKLQSINAKYDKPYEVMEKAYYDYRSKSGEYRQKIQKISDSASDPDDDLSLIEDAIISLGIKPSAVKSFVQAKKLVTFIQDKGKSLQRQFPDIS
tara:strand:- start:131 stop:496 length:366 start_codon:yes stop_codon:yes gene_type:complete